MPTRVASTHRIRIAAPLAQCRMLFTPAGEELWVDGWRPHYRVPADGRTEPGMVFTTGSGDEYTVWILTDFEQRSARETYARYARTTPALRTGLVEVRCLGDGGDTTEVEVGYTLTALNEAGERSLAAYEGERYVEMIEGWRREIEARLPGLLAAAIR